MDLDNSDLEGVARARGPQRVGCWRVRSRSARKILRDAMVFAIAGDSPRADLCFLG